MMKKQLLLASVGSVMATAAVAQAQQAPVAATPVAPAGTPQADPAPDSGTLGDIIVTAQKRAQNLQTVPVAITAVSAATIDEKRIVTFQDLPRAAPTLTLTEQGTSINNAIVLRGIGTTTSSAAVESSVAVIVDDVAVANQAEAFTNLNDIEQIEILRGPQGTLFGKNASAGAINIRTAAPSDTLTATLQETLTTDRETRTSGSVSAPITDTVGFRASGYYDGMRGYLLNVSNGDYVNNMHNYGGRLRIEAKPTDTLGLTFIADYGNQSSNGTNFTYRSVEPGAIVFNNAALPLNLAGITPGEGNYRVRQDENGLSRSNQLLLSTRASLDLGAATLISVTSYQHWHVDYIAEFDNSDQPLGAGGPTHCPEDNGLVTGGRSSVQCGPFTFDNVAQELRLVSNGAGRFSYLVGGYFSRTSVDRVFWRDPNSTADWTSINHNRTLAGFAQADYRITPTTKLTGAIRVNNEAIDIDFANRNPLRADCYVGGSGDCKGSNNDTAITWKASIQQDLAPRIFVYASAATGYKGYGYDVGTPFTQFKANNPAKPEHSNAYEIGLKSRFADNRVQFNVAGFWTDYSNLQATSTIVDATTTPVTLRSQLNNVGKVRTRGIEVETNARPLDWLQLDASGAYVDARITSFPLANCYAGQLNDPSRAASCVDIDGPGGPLYNGISNGPLTTRVQNLAGHTLPNAPKFKATAGAVADFALDTRGTKGNVAINYQYQTAVQFDLFDGPRTIQSGYGLMNGSIGATQGNLSIKLFVNNLFDKHYESYLLDAYSSFGSKHVIEQIVPRNSQRYVGITLGYKY